MKRRIRKNQFCLGLNEGSFKPFFIPHSLWRWVCCLFFAGLFLFPQTLSAQALDYQETIISGEHRNVVSRYGSARTAIEGSYLAVGDIYDSTAGFNAGAVRVYVNREGQWTFLDKIIAPSASSYDYFGFAMAIEGDYLFVVHGDYNLRLPYRSLLIYRLSDTDVTLVSTHSFETTSPHYFSQEIHAHQDRVMVNRFAPGFKDNFMVYRLVDDQWTLEEEIDELSLATTDIRNAEVFVMSIEDNEISFLMNETSTSNEPTYYLKKMRVTAEGHWVLDQEQALGFSGVIEFDESNNIMCMTHRLGSDTAAKVFTKDDTGVWQQRFNWVKYNVDHEYVGGCAVINDRVFVHSYLSDGAFRPQFSSRMINELDVKGDVVTWIGSMENVAETNGHTYIPFMHDDRYLVYSMADTYVVDTGRPIQVDVSGVGHGTVSIMPSLTPCSFDDSNTSCLWEMDAGTQATIMFSPDPGYRFKSFDTSVMIDRILYDDQGVAYGFESVFDDDATLDVFFEPLLPDLVIKKVKYRYKKKNKKEKQVHLKIKVLNMGEGPASAHQLEVYHAYKNKRLRERLGLSETLLLDVPMLQPGQSVMMEAYLKAIPLRGTAYLSVQLDVNNVVEELNETNNQWFKKYWVKKTRWIYKKTKKWLKRCYFKYFGHRP